MQKRNSKKFKPEMPITAALFTTLISYLLSEYCSRSFVVKLERFFDEVNEKLYEEDGDLEIYHRIVKRMMRLILDENIKDSDVILERLTSSPRDGDEIYDFLEALLEEIGEEEMNSSLALFLENEFISRLNYVNVTPKAEQLRLILSKLENQDYDSYDEIINDLHTTSNEMNKAVIARSVAAVTLPDVVFGETDAFNTALRKVRNFMNDDKRIIRTGVKRLDKFLNGGWQAGRVYLANGISGGWKSGFLLNAALWTCRYNDEVVCNDRLKKPCVVYLSQENDIEETIERIISYIGGLDEKSKALPEDELAGLMRQYKLVGSRWELRILYRPKNSIATGDIDTLISEIESEGDVEVKFLVHDYIKRIKPNVVTGDIRIDLGEAANDLSIIAKKRKIPILTANQLNRDAYRTLNETSKDEKTQTKLDQGKKLDPSMISESQLLLENVDLAFGQHREQTADGSVFIAFKKFKDRSSKRVSVSAFDYFAHPFDGGNGMRLMEDVLLDISLSINSIEERFGTAKAVDVEEEDEIFNDAPSNKTKRTRQQLVLDED